jgi:hypothetical protein
MARPLIFPALTERRYKANPENDSPFSFVEQGRTG